MPILDGPEPRVVFIRRSAHMRRHAGQIAFPGGVVESQDEDDRLRTALREAEEELGLAPDRVEIVMRLPESESLRTGFLITPFVGTIAPGPFVLDGNEIAEVFEVPLRLIVAPGGVHAGFELVDGREVETWHFDYGAMHVWGATGRILRSFVDVYEQPGSVLRARFHRDAPAL